MDQILRFISSASGWLGIPNDITPWELLNSEFITAAIIGIFGLILGRKVNRLSERAEDNATAAAYERELEDIGPQAAEATPEAATEKARGTTVVSDVPPPGAGTPGREIEGLEAAPAEGDETASLENNSLQSTASHIVNAAKRFVDERLGAQKDGRKRRKYENLGKRDYRVRALAARDDGLITSSQALNLLAIFETWRPYGTGRKTVTDDVIRKMRAHLRAAEKEKFSVRSPDKRKRSAANPATSNEVKEQEEL